MLFKIFQNGLTSTETSNNDTGYETSSTRANEHENDEPMFENEPDFDDIEEIDQQKGPPKLFTMNLVNSYGNAQLDQLENDGQPLKVTSMKIFFLVL